MTRLVLASASPRRRRLLEEAGLEFEVIVSGVDERCDPKSAPEVTARELAQRKAVSVAGALVGEPALVLGADTVVALEGEGRWRLLGKPADAEGAREMLCMLSGSRHVVVTGVCVVRTSDSEVFLSSEQTWVVMREITPAEIDAYVASGEWQDKAGGYAIQESADAFVEGLEGGFDNVVGLPVGLVRQLLETAGA